MGDLIFCLDSGTTSVKAAAFDERGRLVSLKQGPNSALRRSGLAVEQDMDVSRGDAFSVLRECAKEVQGTPVGIIVTGQGDGLWAIDREGKPVGHAMTWLDGRSSAILPDLQASGAVDEIQRLTSTRPNSAMQTLQLVWLKRNDRERYDRISHILRIKEWLFFSLTGSIKAEPASLLHTWGDWKSGAILPELDGLLGLERGAELLPPIEPIGVCRAVLRREVADHLGLPAGLPVLIGPGDVQATSIGLGMGLNPDVNRCSIFGTSAIHTCFGSNPNIMVGKPPGALSQTFALGGYFCSYPSFNGTTLFEHVARQVGRPDLARNAKPDYSGVVIHPFYEPGGERSPYLAPDAKGSIFGVTSTTTAEQLAWAAREALVFIARKSHDMMGARSSAIALGGGLAADPYFASFMATATGRPIRRSTEGHASLTGNAVIAAIHLLGLSRETVGADWIGAPTDIAIPQNGSVAEYAERKYEIFSRLVDVVSPMWRELSELAKQTPSKSS